MNVLPLRNLSSSKTLATLVALVENPREAIRPRNEVALAKPIALVENHPKAIRLREAKGPKY